MLEFIHKYVLKHKITYKLKPADPSYEIGVCSCDTIVASRRIHYT